MAHKHTHMFFSALEGPVIFMAQFIFAVGKDEMYFTLAQLHEHWRKYAFNKNRYKMKFCISTLLNM